MRFLIILSVCSLSLCSPLESQYAGVSGFDQQWEQFKTNFDRHYTSEEEGSRKLNFLRNIQFIESHNKKYANGLVSHEVAVNQFSDWSSEEYEALLTPTPALNLTTVPHMTIAEPDPTLYEALPASFDWTAQHKVTAIKNQGQCGACWAFATTSILESAMLIHHNQLLSLSEQMLVDCDKTSFGCKGGWVPRALEYIQQNGIESEAEYPYRGVNENCMNNAARSHLRVKGYVQLRHPASDEDMMAAIYHNGPVAVNVDASGDDFGHYRNGILSTGNRNLNHYVTIVGWGPNYWIVKNSWGTQWGQNGFGFFAKGMDIRGVNQWVFYPNV